MLVLRLTACLTSQKTFIPAVQQCHIRSLKVPSFNRCNLKKILEEMPKSTNVPLQLRHIRIKNKAAANKYKQPPSRVNITFLGNGSKGNPNCLFMSSDHKSYIFNCGEGSQRLAHEHKMKLSKLEQIFFTHKSWNNIGGLIGLTLTIKDIGVPEISLHGPPEISQLYKISHYFTHLKNLKVVNNDLKKTFSDDTMTVDYVMILPKDNKVMSRDVLEIIKSSSKSDEENNSDEDFSQNKRQKFEEYVEMSVAYICRLHGKPGQLQIDKCVDKGVPPGPLLGELKNGNDITLPDGCIVRAVDVLSPIDPGPIFIVVECPNTDYLDSLLTNPAFEKFQNSPDDPTSLASLVIHLTPPEVAENKRYQEWLHRFDATTLHLFANRNSYSLCSLGIHEIQNKLHFVEPTVFPLLHEIPENTVLCDEIGSALQVKSCLTYHLRPSKGIDVSNVPQLDETILQEFKQLEGLEEAHTKMQEKIKNSLIDTRFDRDYPEVIFLGTGSAVPSKARNVSSILVNVSADRSIILDCGEGTYKQLLRFSGPERTAEILQNLTAIFISHLHADHHTGLINLLLEREAAFKKIKKPCPKINLIAPIQISTYLESYHTLFEPIVHLFKLIPSYLLQYEKRKLNPFYYEQLMQELQIKEMATVFVHHCFAAFGLTFTTECNFKLVYSGDTMPCEKLIQAGKNCDMLIHEATMEDDLAEDAIVKTHSTTSQAIEVGQKMKSQFTILTHFSQRYAKLPFLNSDIASNVGFAFDNMNVKPKDLFKLPLMVPVLKIIFKEEHEEMNKRAEKRKLQKELISKLAS